MNGLEYLTLLFLVALFVAAEVYRIRGGRRGILVAADDPFDSPAPLPVTRVRVMLDDNREVAASLNCCTACIGRLNVGDEVRVAETKDGWVVDLAWFRSSGCGRRACAVEAAARVGKCEAALRGGLPRG